VITSHLELTIWVHLEGVPKPTDVQIMDTAYVSALCREIIRAYPDELGGRGTTKLVVRAPDATLPDGTDPKSVKPAEFKQELRNPKLTLAEVLKPTIAGAKGEYEVYVELPAKPKEEGSRELCHLRADQLLGWPRKFDILPSVAEVFTLKLNVPHAVHTAPIPKKFVGRTQEAKALVESIKKSGFGLAPTSVPLKMQNPAFEYSTISGAGKSTWGFHIQSVLEKAFPDCIISRVSLNFNGGTGAGSDKGDFQDIKNENDVDIPLARALFARGCLETTPGNVKGFSQSSRKVIDLLCQLARGGHDPSQKLLLYIHLDEAAMLDENGSSVAKWVTYALLDYNAHADRLGWVVPVLTHTCPLKWVFQLSRWQLERLFLSPLTLDELREAAGWVPEVNADRLLNCSGGHASLLQLLLDALPHQPVNPDKYAEGRKALFANKLVKCTAASFGKLSAKHKLDVIHAILLQSRIEPDKKGNWPPLFSDLWTAGVLFCHIQPSDSSATVSMPLPAFLPCLDLCGIAIPEYLDRDSKWFDPSKAFEVVATLWAASRYSTALHFCGELANFKALAEHKENVFAVFADRQQAKIDGAGKYQAKKRKNQAQGEKKMVLIQTKRAQSHDAKQKRQEVMEVVEWAVENTTGAITVMFVTDRKSDKVGGYQEDMAEVLDENRDGCSAVYLDRTNIYQAIPPGILAI